MAGSYNKVVLLGRLSRDPEIRTFASGGSVANIGFVVDERKKENGQWVDKPVWLDLVAFGGGERGGRDLANIFQQYLKKGSQCLVEGRLTLDQWQDKATGQNRSKVKIIVTDVQFVGSKADSQKPAADDGFGDFNDGGTPERSQPSDTPFEGESIPF